MYMYPKIAYFVLLSDFIFFVMCIWKLSNGWTDKNPSHIYRIVSWLSVDIIFIYIIIPVWFLFCRRNCNRFVNELWRSCYPVCYMCYSLLCDILSFFVVHSFGDVSLSVLFYNDVHCTAYRPAIICGSCRMLFKFLGEWNSELFFHVPGSIVWIREPEPSKPTYFWRPYHDHFKHFLWLLFLWWAKSIHLKLICKTRPMNSTAWFGSIRTSRKSIRYFQFKIRT